MKKGSKEMLKTILSNQELIMKALKIEIPVKKVEPKVTKTATAKKVVKAPANAAKKVVGKPAVKKAK
jgi:hypothetical protein